VANDGNFLVEDFLGAIASQLDRTQDALALKAINRPLTYAINDFTMELKVFVDLDPDGRVRFRSPGANETGASSVHIGFTTITRPMIEENTVDLTMTHGPSLSEAGLSEEERRRLEYIGVRTTAELARLKGSTGTTGIARVADIPVDRLKAALSFGRPQVSSVRPIAAPRPPAPAVPAPGPATPAPRLPPPTMSPPQSAAPAPAPPRATAPQHAPRPRLQAPAPRPAAPITMPRRAAAQSRIEIAPSTRHIEVAGSDLIGGRGAPGVRLDGQPLAVIEADDARLLIELADGGPRSGTLEIDHGDGEVQTYDLQSDDPWAPEA
jgi:hypothetical protein